jgi:succinate dehydrogenase/fumarate reductase flavoprotein subunit
MDRMADQKRPYDLVIVGTGSAASAVAFRCRAAGWRVAVIRLTTWTSILPGLRTRSGV